VALYADLDYDSMQYAMNYLRQRRGAEVVRISLPEPASAALVTRLNELGQGRLAWIEA